MTNQLRCMAVLSILTAALPAAESSVRIWSRIWLGGGLGTSANGLAWDGADAVFVCGVADKCAALSKWTMAGTACWQYASLSSSAPFFDAAVDGEQNVYCCGLASAGGYDRISIAKFNRDGSNLWWKLWGGTHLSGSVGYGVAVQGAQVYVCGYTGESNSTQCTDMALLKLTADGALVWSRVWGSPAYDLTHDVFVDAGGHVFVSGQSEDDINGQTNAADVGACLTKWTADGSCLWTRVWGSVTFNTMSGVSGDGSNAVYVCGTANDTFDGQPLIGGEDLFLSAFDAQGSSCWSRLWGSTANDGATRVVCSSGNVVRVTGYTSGAFDGQAHVGGEDLCMSMFTSTGTRPWSCIWGSTADDGGKNIADCGPGQWAVCGITAGSFDGQNNNGTYAHCLSMFAETPEPGAGVLGLALMTLLPRATRRPARTINRAG